MTRRLSIVALACLALAAFVSLGWTPAPGPSDEDAIKSRYQAFEAAWNKHDTASMAAIWATDGDLINPYGRIAKGRPAVETLFKDEHGDKGPFKSSHFEFKNVSQRMVGGGSVSLMDATCDITHITGPDGASVPSEPHHVLVVWEKSKDGLWMITAARPYTFKTMPEKGENSGHDKHK